MFRYVIILLFSGVLLTSRPLKGQDIIVEFGKLKISQKDTFSITLVFPKEEKKAFQAFSYMAFPMITDFAKTTTRYLEDKENKNYKIIQQYKPLKPGKYKIYPFIIRSGNTEVLSDGASVHVSPFEQNPIYTYPEDLAFKETHTDIIFQVTPSRKEVYAGEAIEITASLLVSENNTSTFNYINLFQQANEISRIFSPSNSFLDEYSSGVLEVPILDSVSINGLNYKRIRLYESKFYPLSEGTLSFPSFNFELLKYSTSEPSQTIFWKSEKISFSSKPFSIQIKPLPEHPLKSHVPVGKFSLKEGLSHNRVKTGKHFIYRAIITGEGNLTPVTAPELKENDQLDFYSPVLKQRIIKEGKNAGGKILEFTIIPKEPGTYHLSDYFKWIYFNPYEGKYDTLRSRLIVTVEGESQKDKEISSMDLGSFYEMVSNESNKLRSREKDESLKFFANIIILFMLVTTAILVFKRS